MILCSLLDKDIEPDIILIQESWIGGDLLPQYLQLDNYSAVAQGYKISTHGGLVTYLKTHLNATKIDICSNTTVFEGLVLKVENMEDKSMPSVIVSNIYKPPHDNNNRANIEKFIEEITPLVKFCNETNSEILIGGDFNINLLKMNENSSYSEFIDMMFNNSLYPKITMPTRFSTYFTS